MKRQILFSGRKGKYFNLSSAEKFTRSAKLKTKVISTEEIRKIMNTFHPKPSKTCFKV